MVRDCFISTASERLQLELSQLLLFLFTSHVISNIEDLYGEFNVIPLNLIFKKKSKSFGVWENILLEKKRKCFRNTCCRNHLRFLTLPLVDMPSQSTVQIRAKLDGNVLIVSACPQEACNIRCSMLLIENVLMASR